MRRRLPILILLLACALLLLSAVPGRRE